MERRLRPPLHASDGIENRPSHKMKKLHRRLALLLALAVTGVLVTSAVAFWTSTGDGTAAATVTNPDPLTIDPGDPLGFLYPGTSATVSVVVTNPNPFPVNVPSLVLDTSQGENNSGFESDQSGCNADVALSYEVQDNGGPGWTVPADAVELPLTLAADALTLATTATTECQNAAFKIYLAVGA
jgi:hypothetical protein